MRSAQAVNKLWMNCVQTCAQLSNLSTSSFSNARSVGKTSELYTFFTRQFPTVFHDRKSIINSYTLTFLPTFHTTNKYNYYLNN